MQKKIAYYAKYIDDMGVVETEIWNDGKELTMRVRGVSFKGTDFDSLEAINDPSSKSLENFTLYQHRDLCNCKIICDIPIYMSTGKEIVSSILSMNLILGKPRPPFGIDREDLILELKYNDKRSSRREKAVGSRTSY